MNILRKKLHYKDETSDKVYIIDVNKITGSKPYIVMASWGARDADRLSSQIKGEFQFESQALDVARKLLDDKKKGRSGYKDARANIVIKGLAQHDKANVSHVMNEGAKGHVNNTVVDIVDDKAFTRNIKI